MYNVLNDDGNILNDKPVKTKKEAKEFIIWNYRCLVRDGFLQDYDGNIDTLEDYFNECFIVKCKDDYTEFAELIWNEHNEEMKRPYKEKSHD